MPTLVIEAGELTGYLRLGAEQRVLSSLPDGHAGGAAIRIGRITIEYELSHPAPGTIPNVDPWGGYGSDHPELAEPNGEGAHPNDDATGHVERTHEDFGPRPEKRHITDLPSWGRVGC